MYSYSTAAFAATVIPNNATTIKTNAASFFTFPAAFLFVFSMQIRHHFYLLYGHYSLIYMTNCHIFE